MSRFRRPLSAASVLAAAVFLLTPGVVRAAQSSPAPTAGLVFEYFSRTVAWDDNAGQSALAAPVLMAEANFALGPRIIIRLEAGAALSRLNGLVFRALPISLDYEAGNVAGLAAGAAVDAGLLRSGELEIRAEGRFVSIFGSAKAWPLTGFAVDGEARGKPTWFTVSAGPRFAYLAFGRFVPFVSVSAGWLWGSFEMHEILGDLAGYEKKAIKGKAVLDIAAGAEIEISRRLAIQARAGFLPFAGGVDAEASLGLLYEF
jgi:hypothetical protein